MSPKRKNFWNKEYTEATHLSISDEPAEDLKKFTRFLERKSGKSLLNVTRKALDVGCGNGRNLIYLAQQFGMHGLGYDSSSAAVAQAKRTWQNTTVNRSVLPRLEFSVRDLREPIPLPDKSVTIALDMMASHVLKQKERKQLRDELYRVLKPGGWLFFKSFLLEGDQNAEVLLREHPGPEDGMYVHPKIGVAEYVWPSVEVVEEFFSEKFTVHKTGKSHKHVTKAGKPWKRRTVSVYLEKTL